MRVASNFRVVAYVDDSFILEKSPKEKERSMVRRAENLRAEIHRHCDNYIDLRIERDFVCSHCDSTWETDEKGEPMCCTEAQKEWAELAEAPKDAA